MNNLKQLLKKCVIFCAFMCVTITLTADEVKAKNFVDKVAKDIIKTVSNESMSDVQLKSSLRKIILSNFDITWMSKFVAGQAYKNLSEEKKQEYTEAYSSYLISSYLPILRKYTNESYSINKTTVTGPKNFDVDVIILRNNGKPPLSLRYHIVELENGDVKARDMVIEGVSTILNQRSEFINTIQSKGVEGLIAELKSGANKNKNMA